MKPRCSPYDANTKSVFFSGMKSRFVCVEPFGPRPRVCPDASAVIDCSML